jgi:hypothetical protein
MHVAPAKRTYNVHVEQMVISQKRPTQRANEHQRKASSSSVGMLAHPVEFMYDMYIMNSTPLSFSFTGAYFFFLLLPMFKPALSKSYKFSSFFLLFFGLTGPAAAVAASTERRERR